MAQKPMPRTSAFRESLLCVAIRRRVLVELLFGADPAEVLFEPTVVYRSSEHETHVGGVLLVDSDKPFWVIEVAKIRSVNLTQQPFVVSPIVNRFDAAYAIGLICLADAAGR